MLRTFLMKAFYEMGRFQVPLKAVDVGVLRQVSANRAATNEFRNPSHLPLRTPLLHN
jgi:hypothetical protein